MNKKTTDQVLDVSNQTPAHDTDSKALYCDKCSQSVDQLIQCESCEVWFCGACESVPAQILDTNRYIGFVILVMFRLTS